MPSWHLLGHSLPASSTLFLISRTGGGAGSDNRPEQKAEEEEIEKKGEVMGSGEGGRGKGKGRGRERQGRSGNEEKGREVARKPPEKPSDPTLRHLALSTRFSAWRTAISMQIDFIFRGGGIKM